MSYPLHYYYLGPKNAVEAITETPWVRLSSDDKGVTKRLTQLDPVPTGCTQLTQAEALEEVAKPEWNEEP
jgi:hypothetical protein